MKHFEGFPISSVVQLSFLTFGFLPSIPMLIPATQPGTQSGIGRGVLTTL
jgi:hypothetical protein